MKATQTQSDSLAHGNTEKHKQIPQSDEKGGKRTETKDEKQDTIVEIGMSELTLKEALFQANEFIKKVEWNTSPEDIEKNITLAKTQSFWESHPKLTWCDQLRKENILAICMVRGFLPDPKPRNVLCGFPGCKKNFQTNTEKLKHWKSEHQTEESYKETWVTNILNCLGINMKCVRKEVESGEEEEITPPIMRCPQCRYVASNIVPYESHSKTHKEESKKTEGISKMVSH